MDEIQRRDSFKLKLPSSTFSWGFFFSFSCKITSRFFPQYLKRERVYSNFAAMPCRAIDHVSALGVEWVKGLGGGGVEGIFVATEQV